MLVFAQFGNLKTVSKCGGFHQHYGHDNYIRNNIFAFGAEGDIMKSRDECGNTLIFERNIVLTTHGKVYGISWNNNKYHCDSNLIWSPNGKPLQFSTFTQEQWQSLGQDTHSLFVDPLCVDPAGGDFTLRADSPAHSLGFTPIDLSAVGPRYRGERPATFEEWPQEVEAPRAIVHPYLEVGDLPQANATFDVYRKLEIYPEELSVPADQPVPFVLRLENRGDAPASGAIAITFADGAGSIQGDIPPTCTIAPGETLSLNFDIQLSSSAQDSFLEIKLIGEGFVSTGVFVTPERKLTFARIPVLSSVDEVEHALAGQPAYAINTKLYTLGNVRFAVANDAFAISANIIDYAMSPAEAMPWCNSSIELFANMPGETFAQFFLLPETETAPVKMVQYIGGEIVTVNEVQLACQRTEHGYAIQALVPLSRLTVDPRADTFMFETVIRSAPQADKKVLAAGLCKVHAKASIANATSTSVHG